MEFITILNEIIFPVMGYSLLGFIVVYFTINAVKSIKKEAENTAILIVKLQDADYEIGNQVKNAFSIVCNEFMERRKNDDI